MMEERRGNEKCHPMKKARQNSTKIFVGSFDHNMLFALLDAFRDPKCKYSNDVLITLKHIY